MNTQWFKDKLLKYSTELVSEELNYATSIQSAEISYFNSIKLNKVELRDIFENEMILVENLDIKFDLLTILNKNIVIENVFINKPHVHLIINKQDGLLNLNEFIKSIQNKLKKENSKPQKIEFKIASIKINEGIMSYDDRRKDSIKNVFDYYHFQFQKINLSADSFSFKDKISSFKAYDVNFIEPSNNKTIHNINTTTRIGLDFIELSNLDAQIGESSLNNYLRFDFENFKAFDDFNNLVKIDLTLNESIISSKEIGMFSSTIRENINEKWIVSGNYKGKISNFRSDNFSIRFGDNSIAKGKLSLDGLPDFYNTFLDIKLEHSHVKATDLEQYFPSKTAKKNLPKFGHIEANGSFIGFPLDFVAFGDFTTSLGKINSDINLKISDGKEKAYYKGELSTNDFKLGGLTKLKEYVRRISIDGKIEGTGLTLESANFNLDANIQKLELLNYTYKNITTKANFSKSTFDGVLDVNDENLVFNAEGLIDFSRKKPVIKIKSSLKKSNLKALNFTSIESNISTKLDINIIGIDIDDIVGAAKFDSLKITYDSNYLDLSSITLFSSLLNNKRSFSVISPYFNFKMNGDYKFTTLQKDLIVLKNELILGIRNDKQEIEKYYQSKKENNEFYKIDFYLNLLDMNPLFNLYNLPIEIASNTEFFGDFKQSRNTILNFNSELSYFKYENYELKNSIIDFNSSKFSDKSDILAMALVDSDNQKIYGYETEFLHLESVWANDHLEIESFLKQKDETNNISLSTNIDFFENKTKINLKEFEISIYDQLWEMADSNSIIIRKDEYEFKSLSFGHELQNISLSGEISKNPNKTAILKLENFNLDLLNPISPLPISGTTHFNLHLKDAFNEQIIFGNYTIDSLNISENLLGHVKGMLQWNKNKEEAYVNLNLIRNESSIANVNGLISPFRSKNQLNLKAKVTNQPVKLIEPFFRAYASNFKGDFSTDLNISGEFDYPVITGDVNLNKVNLKYNYLNVNYTTSSTLKLTKDKIEFPKIDIQDKFGNSGLITGSINHKGFKNYNNNLLFEFNNLLILNTNSEDNSLYFGKVFATGNAKITGLINNITFKANAATNKNTQIYIPLNGFEGVDDKEFIRFISFNNRSAEIDSTLSNIDLSGINMDFNFEITPDAYMEIIFDAKAGDIIRGNGNGDLNLIIDTRGDFNVYGDYEINKGVYNFTLLDIVNKEFTVTPGSIVSWNGDPYKGILNIEAMYEQRVSLSPIVLDTNIWINNPSFKSRKYPTNVLLNLNGELLQPEILLDIDILDEYPSELQASVNTFENEIKNNEQELNRQVFSLIILKQLAQLNSFNNLNLGASAGRSMSELISNQLSYWMSQVDDNLEIDLDLGALNTADNNSYQLRLSYSLLDGRLRLSNQTDYDKSSDLSTITGEWTVEYMIKKDGRLKLKMYNRTSQNSYSNDIDNSTQTTAGASIIYTKGFNNLKELFRKKDKKEKK